VRADIMRAVKIASLAPAAHAAGAVVLAVAERFAGTADCALVILGRGACASADARPPA
jgi:hypothetical protein